MNEFAFSLVAVIFGLATGWILANTNIANECRKLESFYVGNSVFVCKEKQ